MTSTCAARATFWARNSRAISRRWATNFTRRCWRKRSPRSARARLQGLTTVDDQWAPQINLGVPVLIPEAYVPDLDLRLGLYRRLSGADHQGGTGRLRRRTDRPLRPGAERGEHPAAGRADQGDVQARRHLAAGRRAARAPRCSSTTTSSPIRPGWSISSRREGRAAKISGNKIVLPRDWKTEADRIKGAFAIARDLAEKVVRPKAWLAPAAGAIQLRARRISPEARRATGP